ncbi:hypothetical protein [Algoriphagus sp.]|uniref:hypothetical protein n=1 Tax=Algoriphagus sp. TaxID=1872435 RepID=UPI0025DFA8B7|nr:hypothetical protein [Algoriphagus sp.]
MKIWKSLLILLFIILLAGGGFWVYQNYFSTRKINSLDIISQEAIFVFETYQGAETWNTLVNDPVWGIFQTLPAFDRLSKQLVTLDSLTGENGQIAKLVQKEQLTVSLHSTGIENFELLYTLNLNPSKTSGLIEDIKAKIPAGSRFQNRMYSDQEVIEFYDSENNRGWSISILGDLVVFSSSSFLVEQAIRFYMNENQETYSKLITGTTLSSDSPGRLLLSGKGLAAMLKGIAGDRESQAIASLEILNTALALDLSFEEGRLEFVGPVYHPDPINFTPSIRANLTAIESLISNRTLALTQYNLESIFETQKIENRAFPYRSTLIGEIQRTLTDRGFFDNFSGELYFLDLEKYGGSDQNLALLARTFDASAPLDLLKAFQKSENEENSDFYLDYEILFIPEEEFPAHLFSGKFHGFGQTFVTSINDILVFCNSQQAMKLILDDFTSNNTWRNSPNSPAAKSELNSASGFSKIYLIDEIWAKWTQNTNPSWSSFLQKYSGSFQSFPWLSLHINKLPDRTEATLKIPYKGDYKAEIKQVDAISLQPNKTISLDQTLIYGPSTALNYQDNTQDILVQDGSNVIHLFNEIGDEVYSYPLDGPIVSDIFQIDYYKNGKLQILLATKNKIYGIDRLGNLLPGYPFDLGNEWISHLNLVDYSNNKEYRYFISTEDGNLYLLDKTGQQLDGWNPLSINEKTTGPPAHYRIPGKGDYMVALGENGNLFLFNRRGERQGGTPINFGEAIKSEGIVWRDPSSRSYKFVSITSNGEIIQSNFDGEIGYRNQLIKDDKDSEFILVADQKANDFVFVSRQYNEVSILDKTEKLLMNIRVSSENLIYQYFDFGSDRQIFALTDLTQEFSYLYDLEGNLLTTMPLESSNSIQITYQSSKGQYLIRTISGSRITEFLLAD